jgi:UDP-3-O-[3-hydroxymyristoyl] glucosamine N-acyltransferase
MTLDYAQLKKILPQDCEFIGNRELVFNGLQSLYECAQDEITWIKPGVRNEKELINSTKASGIICSPDSFQLYNGETQHKLFLLHHNPKQIFFKIVQYIYNLDLNKQSQTNIHPTAIIDKDCVIGEHVVIGEYSVIGACKIGNNVIISNHVKIYDCVSIGNNCKIREYCSIGGEGFGFIKNEDGENEFIPHIGSVLIEDNVTIYPFSNVDRGTLGKTIIQSGTVIDHYVHVGHNTRTGKNNIIAAGTIMAGGCQIKDNCFIGVNTLIKEKVIIGSDVYTGMGAVVVKDVEDKSIIIGNPAVPISEFKKWRLIKKSLLKE